MNNTPQSILSDIIRLSAEGFHCLVIGCSLSNRICAFLLANELEWETARREGSKIGWEMSHGGPRSKPIADSDLVPLCAKYRHQWYDVAKATDINRFWHLMRTAQQSVHSTYPHLPE
jgi:hypothetical protein